MVASHDQIKKKDIGTADIVSSPSALNQVYSHINLCFGLCDKEGR